MPRSGRCEEIFSLSPQQSDTAGTQNQPPTMSCLINLSCFRTLEPSGWETATTSEISRGGTSSTMRGEAMTGERGLRTEEAGDLAGEASGEEEEVGDDRCTEESSEEETEATLLREAGDTRCRLLRRG